MEVNTSNWEKIRYAVLYAPSRAAVNLWKGLNAFHTHFSPILAVESSIWVFGEQTMTLGARGLSIMLSAVLRLKSEI